MSEISDARLALHGALVSWTADVLEAERVHLYPPEQIASPCLWITQPGVRVVVVGSPGVRLRVITFGVGIVVDGATQPQCELLDELVARVSDAIQQLPHAEDGGASPQSFDIGGVSQRGVAYDVACTTYARSFCARPVPVPVP